MVFKGNVPKNPTTVMFLRKPYSNIYLALHRHKSNFASKLSDKYFVEKVNSLNLKSSELQNETDIIKLREIYNSFVIPTDKILQKNFDLSKTEATNVIMKNKFLKDRCSLFVDKNLQLVKESLQEPANFKENLSFWLQICKYNHAMLTHRIGMMREMGMPIHMKTILSFKRYCKATIGQLQSENLFFIDALREKILSLGIPIEVFESLFKMDAWKDQSLTNYWLEGSRLLIRWQTEMSVEEMTKLEAKKYFFIHRSYTEHYEIVSMLKKRFKFTKDKFKSHSYIFSCVSWMIREYMEHDSPVCGYSVESLVKMLPSVMRRSLLDTLQTNALINFINLQTKSGTTTLGLFTYPPSTVLSRIEYFINRTSLSDLRLSPNSPLLIVNFERSKSRLERYEEEFGAITFLPSPSFLFHPSVSYSVKVKRAYFVQFLKMIFEIPSKEIYKALSQARLIHYPDFGDIKLNLVFLLKQEFSLQCIRDNYHLLFYPHEILVKCYEDNLFQSKYGPYFKQIGDMDKLLQLLLYKVVRTHISLGGSYL